MTDYDDKTPPRQEYPHVTTETNGTVPHRDKRAEDSEPPYDAMSPEHLLKLATVCARNAANSAMSADIKASQSLRATDDLKIDVRDLKADVGDLRAELKAASTHLASDVGDIARALGAKRTYSSGQVVLSLPPASLKTSPSPTGSHIQVDPEDLRKYERLFAEQNAREQGAREALARLQAEKDAADVRQEKLSENRWKKITILITAFSVASGSLVAILDRAASKPTAPTHQGTP
jgi:hypothetical protein